MTYSSLTANINIMRTGNEDVLTTSKYTDAACLLLHKTAAKLEMQLDIEQALQIESTDTTTLDEVTDVYSTRLSRALAYKQLALFYQLNDTGADTKNRSRWEMYRKQYDREKALFSGLQADAPITDVSSTIFYR